MKRMAVNTKHVLPIMHAASPVLPVMIIVALQALAVLLFLAG
jgi:hypothetical protein